MNISRRAALGATAALAAVPAIGLPQLASAQAAASAAANGYYRYKVGDITVTAIHEGFANRPLDGFVRNAELKDVKQALADKFMSTEALPISFTTLVLETGGKIALIDTGLGDNAPPTAGRWMANFKAAGFDPAKVNTVVFSHFHGDHIGGFRLKDGTAQFPNAEVMVPEAEWAFWMDDARMNAAPDAMKGAFQMVRRMFGPVAKDVKQFKADQEVLPGVTAVAAYGHTPGHTAFAVTSGNARFMIVSDTTNHPALFVRNPDWSAVFDQDADMARATRHKMLDMVAKERMQVAFYHAPFPATGYVAKEGKGYEFVPAQWM